MKTDVPGSCRPPCQHGCASRPRRDDDSVALRVVLVDDDRRFRAVARRTLVADGVDVVAEVEDGADAVAAIALWRPDVVLLDIELSGVSGLDVARRLRAEGGGPAVLLISTRDATYGNRLAAGLAAGYLPKAELSLQAILELIQPVS
ncbi:MAG: response regulator transcription factor [Actinobacteria bacterium]|nr:response regulator transcription factor [Actinomycetota bacterium]